MAAEHVIAGICGFTMAMGLVAYSRRQIILEYFEQREREERRKHWERRRQQLEAQWRRADEEFERRFGRPPLTVPPEVQIRATVSVTRNPDTQVAALAAAIAPPLPPPHNPGRRRILPLDEPEL
jgi:hypothetical protein